MTGVGNIVTKLSMSPNLNIAQIMISVFDRLENIVGKGENAGYLHFYFSHNVFMSNHLKVVKT